MVDSKWDLELFLLGIECPINICSAQLFVKRHSCCGPFILGGALRHQFNLLKAALATLHLVVDWLSRCLLSKGCLLFSFIIIHAVELVHVKFDYSLDRSTFEKMLNLMPVSRLQASLIDYNIFNAIFVGLFALLFQLFQALTSCSVDGILNLAADKRCDHGSD